MADFEKGLKRLALAGIGAAAKGFDEISEFLDGKECKTIDELAERGKKVVEDGKEANEELHHKFEAKFDEFYDSHRRSKKEINLDAMTEEEREELLERLKNYKEPEEKAEEE